MDSDSSRQDQNELEMNEREVEALKKTTRISLEEALSAKPPPKKSTSSLIDQGGEKKATGLISGIPTHTAPIPQTIRLKRPSTSPIVITPPDLAAAPTVVKVAHAGPSAPASETATIIKKPIPPRPLNETSRIIVEIEPQPSDIRQKTAPILTVSPIEPTPAPKTIRLKQPSTIIAPAELEAKQAPVPDVQTAKKSETAKIELPKDAVYQAPVTQRKTIKIKRTDRNIIPRTVTLARPAETKPQAEAIVQKEEQISKAPIQDEPLPVFSMLAGLAAVCLLLLVYLLSTQAFGPKLILPVPPSLF